MTQDVNELPILAYDAGGEVRIDACRQRDGKTMWAVRNGFGCLNADGEFEYEPMPSSRDDEFLARCRFPSAQDALHALTLHRSKA
jgi:hypothetical protein